VLPEVAENEFIWSVKLFAGKHDGWAHGCTTEFSLHL
jgi:hypothetical protein